MDDNFHENCYNASKRQLNLSHRNLRSLDCAVITAFAHCTEYLDLSHNRINNINWIYEFTKLRCLIMDDNRLREAHFQNLKQPLTNIRTLMLNKNEFSDLKMTADILERLFPNVEYLSLHGNAMCPDNLLLQPFCEFVPYEYNHYRTVLIKSLPNLKFLDHFSLDLLNLKSQTAETKNFQRLHNQEQHEIPILTSTSQDLWAKLKSFLTSSLNQTTKNFLTTTKSNCAQHCAPSSPVKSYSGKHSEGNRYITNSDL